MLYVCRNYQQIIKRGSPVNLWLNLNTMSPHRERTVECKGLINVWKTSVRPGNRPSWKRTARSGFGENVGIAEIVKSLGERVRRRRRRERNSFITRIYRAIFAGRFDHRRWFVSRSHAIAITPSPPPRYLLRAGDRSSHESRSRGIHISIAGRGSDLRCFLTRWPPRRSNATWLAWSLCLCTQRVEREFPRELPQDNDLFILLERTCACLSTSMSAHFHTFATSESKTQNCLQRGKMCHRSVYNSRHLNFESFYFYRASCGRFEGVKKFGTTYVNI